MINKTYRLYSDPGHGWLAVKRAELENLGIIDKISSYSYQKGKMVYLEEDCDMGTFIKAKINANEWTEENLQHFIKESYRDYTPIRSYQNFKC